MITDNTDRIIAAGARAVVTLLIGAILAMLNIGFTRTLSRLDATNDALTALRVDLARLQQQTVDQERRLQQLEHR